MHLLPLTKKIRASPKDHPHKLNQNFKNPRDRQLLWGDEGDLKPPPPLLKSSLQSVKKVRANFCSFQKLRHRHQTDKSDLLFIDSSASSPPPILAPRCGKPKIHAKIEFRLTATQKWDAGGGAKVYFSALVRESAFSKLAWKNSQDLSKFYIQFMGGGGHDAVFVSFGGLGGGFFRGKLSSGIDAPVLVAFCLVAAASARGLKFMLMFIKFRPHRSL